jgi:hypothetical protein
MVVMSVSPYGCLGDTVPFLGMGSQDDVDHGLRERAGSAVDIVVWVI